jgi:hypothetical protein
MARLPRPNPPVEVRCRVVLRQLGEMFIDDVLNSWRYGPIDSLGYRGQGFGNLLKSRLEQLADLFKCEVSDLRLDHTWALENRAKLFKKGVHVDYYPSANDPEWLGYRPHGTQFAGSHDVKTRIRGDNGQLSDNALAKKERKRLRKMAARKQSRSTRFPKRSSQVKLRAKIRSASRWPPKGSQKIPNRRKR